MWNDFLKEAQQLKDFIKDFNLNSEGVLLSEQILLKYQRHVSDKLCEILGSDNPKMEVALEDFLKQNWTLVSGSFLSYTAMPNSEVTQLLVRIATRLSEQTSDSEENSACHFLMPGVATESLHNAYPDLSTCSLEQVLRTHILSENGQYLIPVRQLLERETPDGLLSKEMLNNVYYDFDKHTAEMAYISHEEYFNLLMHSDAMRELLEQAKSHQAIVTACNQNLLVQLEQLSQNLYFNSVAGIGQETIAGEQTYAALCAFQSYYERLPKDAKIPEEVVVEIKKFFMLAGDKEVNGVGAENHETCINTRRGELNTLIHQHRDALSQITLNAENEATLLNETYQKFVEQRKILLLKCDKHEYAGNEKRGLTARLLTNLEIQFSIHSLESARAFADLSMEDMQLIASQSPIAQDFVNQFASLGDMICFFHALRDVSLKTLLPLISPNFKNKFLTNSDDFVALFLTFTNEKLNIVSQHFIQNATDLGYALYFLTPDQRAVVFEAMKDNLPNIIQNAKDLGCALYFLTPDQCAVVCEAIKDNLPSIIQNTTDLRDILLSLTPDQCNVVLEAMKDNLPSIIQNATDLEKALTSLTPGQRAVVLEAMKDNLPSIIKKTRDLRKVLLLLTPDQCDVVLEAMKDNLPNIIQNTRDLRKVLLSLTPEQCAVVLEAMKDNLPNIIQNATNLGKVLTSLTPKRCAVVLDAIKDNLPNLIQNEEDLDNVFFLLKDYQCAVVRKAILPNLIHNAVDLSKVVSHLLPPNQCAVVCETIETETIEIKSVSEFSSHIKRNESQEQDENETPRSIQKNNVVLSESKTLKELINEILSKETWSKRKRISFIESRNKSTGIRELTKKLNQESLTEEAALQAVIQKAKKKHSQFFQPLHWVFKGRDKETNELYRILGKLDVSNKKTINDLEAFNDTWDSGLKIK